MAATGRQKEAITIHDRSMVVTAGAGTGKTFVLVQKYIDLLETRGVSVPQILALTFTDKAAAEMKERIRNEISKREGSRWEKAAEDFMIAPVQTFHSFCAQVLREFPIEAGLEPGFVVLDERQASRIHGKAFEELVHTPQPGPANDAVVHVLSISEPYTLRKILLEMYGKRLSYEQFFRALNEDEGRVIAEWIREVHAIRDAGIRDIARDSAFRSAVSTLLDLAGRYEGADDKAVIFLCGIRPLLEQLITCSCSEEFCSAATAFLGKKPGNVGSRKVWAESDLTDFRRSRKELYEILDSKSSLFGMIVDPESPLIMESLEYLRALSLVFSRYRELVEREKANMGGLDFSDLILNARRLFLEQGELVATHFMPRFRYILVDEFQDTDPAQFDIILAIIGTPAPGTDTLFIVGDPKQSIYLFRDADVTRFKEAQRIILAECKGRVINLDTSFRSTKAVIDLTNILFSRLFASAEKPWEFGYEPILASDGRAGHDGSIDLLLPPRGDDSAGSKRNEADMVARKIFSILHDRPLEVFEEEPDRSYVRRAARYGDIAILLEARTNLSFYLAALSRYGIPFYVHGGTGFYSRQEVFDLYNLLRFLEHRHDDISLAGTLRSPYFGLPDTELFRIAQEQRWTLWNKLQQYAVRSGSASAVHAVDLLQGWRTQAGRTPVVTLIRQILSDSGVTTVYAALPDGKQVLANIEKIVAMARAREEMGGYGLADFTSDLLTAMEEEEQEGEAPLDAIAENAVNIMTVHAAKGLEFPIVVVPDMAMGFPGSRSSIMIGDNPLLVGIKVPDPGNGYEPTDTPMLAALKELYQQKERAEKKRVLYVALTRARDHLVMSGTAPENLDMSMELAKSRIGWIFPALGITGDTIEAGGLTLESEDGSSRVHLTITRDIASIPAEAARKIPELIEVPDECAGMHGTWTPQEFEHPEPVRVWSVTELEKESSSRVKTIRKESTPRYLPGIKGEVRGTIIHEVLRGRDPRIVCSEYGVDDPEAVRQCEEILTRFRSTELMQRVMREFCELPFSITFEGKRVVGKIDRLCELDDGSWVVIDYKSEAVSPEDYSLVAKQYEVSMKVYVEAAKQLVGGTVKGQLYFTETGEL